MLDCPRSYLLLVGPELGSRVVTEVIEIYGIAILLLTYLSKVPPLTMNRFVQLKRVLTNSYVCGDESLIACELHPNFKPTPKLQQWHLNTR